MRIPVVFSLRSAGVGRRYSLALVLVAALSGCAKKSIGPELSASAPNGGSPQQVSESAVEEGLIQQKVDFDGDGEPEIINYYRERAEASRELVKKELDLNRDGKIDVRDYMKDNGTLEKEEVDGDFDGKFEWVDHYQDGVRMETEYDTDGDGRPNVFKYYLKDPSGKIYLDRKERDENGDGKIDVWEKFDTTGAVVITGRDLDGDGKMDEREE
jgi:hypothetical protein